MRIAAAGGDPEKRQVRRAFSRAAGHYDGLATLQRQVARRIFAYLDQAALQPSRVLDLGSGTGYCVPYLRTRFPGTRVLALDLAEGMLQELRRSRASGREVWLLNGDAEALPLAHGSIDLIVSNVALQWCADLPEALRECARVLAPGGMLVFTTFGSRTLGELRESWATIDDYSHVNRFVTEEGVHAALAGAGLASLGAEAVSHTLEYPDVGALMSELKGLGAHNVTANRPRSLTGKRRLAAMAARYQALHAARSGGIRASFEVLFAAARRAE